VAKHHDSHIINSNKCPEGKLMVDPTKTKHKHQKKTIRLLLLQGWGKKYVISVNGEGLDRKE